MESKKREPYKGTDHVMLMAEKDIKESPIDSWSCWGDMDRRDSKFKKRN